MKTPWEFVNNCFLKTQPVTSEQNQWEAYHPCIRLLSFHKKLLKPMAHVSLLQLEIPPWAMGCLIYNLIPKTRKVPWGTKYISAKSVTAEESKEIEAIKNIFCVNLKHAKQLVNITKQQKLSLGEKGRRKK